MVYLSSTDNAAQPGFAWNNDANTGIFRAAEGQVGISCNGVTMATFYDQGMITPQDVTVFSDARLKTDLTPISDALEKLLTLSGYTYRRTDLQDTAQLHMGLIAQEVERVAPEAVSNTAAGIKAVNYNAALALVIQAVKELETRVAALEPR